MEICDSNSSGGSGDGDSGGDSSGGSGGGSANPNTGTPGPLDPGDIGYWLTTLFEGNDLNNPYHGMKAIAPDGTVYTYDADINGWLMPDVTVLEEQGFIADFFNTPDFDGGIISSIGVVVSQGTSRTPVGRLVVGFVTFNLWLYSIYEMSTTLEDKLATVEHCTRLYLLCTGKYGYKNMDCGNCQIYCDTNGYWDSRCPLRDY